MYYHVSIGANIKPSRNIGLAVDQLLAHFGSLTLLPRVYTTSVGMLSESSFINTAAIFESSMAPDAVKHILNDIERSLGRDRGDPLCSVKDRSCDIDICAHQGHADHRIFSNSNEPYVAAVLRSTDYAPIKGDTVELKDGSTAVNLHRRPSDKLVIHQIV